MVWVITELRLECCGDLTRQTYVLCTFLGSQKSIQGHLQALARESASNDSGF